jgi:lysophospholipase L1-like esterase
MDQVMCVSPSWGTITALKLVYAAFDMPQQGEVDRPVIATIANASFFVPTAPQNVVLTNAFQLGASAINCSPSTVSGCNSVSAGQYVAGPGGSTYFAAGTYVTSVANQFTPGTGNTPNTTTINLSTPTTAADAVGGLPVQFTGQIAPVRWGGRVGTVIAPAHDVVTSDPVTIEIPPSTNFFVRTAATMSGVGMQIADMPGSYRVQSSQNYEWSNRSTSLVDHTLDPTNQTNSGGGFWCPVTVLALVTPTVGQLPPAAVLILGDSIATGTGDVPSASTEWFQGYIQRSLMNNVPFVTAARGSTNAGEEATQGNGQLALATDTGITDVLMELDRNDIFETHTNHATVEQYITTIAARYNAAGKRVWCFTAAPSTSSTDEWVTLANQTLIWPDETERESLNADLRNPAMRASFGCYGLIDVAKEMEDPGGSSKWRVDLGAGVAATIDGVHPSAAMHQKIINVGLIRPSMFTVP